MSCHFVNVFTLFFVNQVCWIFFDMSGSPGNISLSYMRPLEEAHNRNVSVSYMRPLEEVLNRNTSVSYKLPLEEVLNRNTSVSYKRPVEEALNRNTSVSYKRPLEEALNRTCGLIKGSTIYFVLSCSLLNKLKLSELIWKNWLSFNKLGRLIINVTSLYSVS